MARLNSQAKGGYYPTPEQVVKQIAESVSPNYLGRVKQENLEHRILDPCCGTGEALKRIGEEIKGKSVMAVRTFGIELHRGRAEEAERNLDEVIEGDLMRAAIGHRSFDLIFLNPPYDLEADGSGRRIETAFLQKCTPYLVDRGTLALIIPAHAVSHVAAHLSTWYYSLRLWPFPEAEYHAYKQVVVFGVKKPIASAYRKGERELTLSARRIKRGSSPEEQCPPVRIWHQKVEKIQFQPMSYDPYEVAREAQEKGLWQSQRLRDALWPGETPDTRPLLPLRQGHLAILSAAGFLNNQILEDSTGNRILVKGRSYKEMVDTEVTREKTVSREFQRTTVMKLDLETGEYHLIKT